MERSKYITIIVSVFVFVAVAFFVFGDQRATKIEITDQYSIIVIDAKCVKITDEVEVRSEPKLISRSEGPTNTFGRTSEANFTVEVGVVYKTDRVLDANGAYYGLRVEDINAVAESQWFPRGIDEDPDGIIWINSKYIEVLA